MAKAARLEITGTQTRSYMHHSGYKYTSLRTCIHITTPVRCHTRGWIQQGYKLLKTCVCMYMCMYTHMYCLLVYFFIYHIWDVGSWLSKVISQINQLRFIIVTKKSWIHHQILKKVLQAGFEVNQRFGCNTQSVFVFYKQYAVCTECTAVWSVTNWCS